MRILLVEDNLALSQLLSLKLSKNYVFDQAFDLKKAYYFLDTTNYDLLIIDLILPDGSGLDLCDYLKQNKISLPILFLTSESDMKQKITCLEIGQTDYLIKPFNLEELFIRIKMLLYKQSNNFEGMLRCGDIKLNPTTHQVFYGDVEVKLNKKEFLLLELLLQHNHQVLSKATLAEKIWQDDEIIFGNSIETTISSLRRKIRKDLIKTIKGVGYSINSH